MKIDIKDFYDGREWNKLFDKYHEDIGVYAIPKKDLDENFYLFAQEGDYAIYFEKKQHKYQFLLASACVWDTDCNKILYYDITFIGRIAGGYDAHITSIKSLPIDTHKLELYIVDDKCCYGGCDSIIECLQFLNKYISDEESEFWR